MSDANRQFYTDPDRIAEGLDFEGIPTQEVYDSYVAWCGENGYRPMNNTNFGKEVKRTFPQSSKCQIRRAGRRLYAYTRIAVIDGSQVATERINRCHHWH